MELSLIAIQTMHKPTDEELRHVATDSLDFWERQKLKLIERKVRHVQKKSGKHAKRISYWMPRWQLRMRKRLGQVQILFDDVKELSDD